MAVQTSVADDPLVVQVTEYVRAYMAHYDASHDFDHIQRVVSLAQHIYHVESAAAAIPAAPAMDLRTITLAAMLHDVGDRKYLKPGEDGATMVLALLRGLGAPEELAQTVQAICSGVSYTSEMRDPAKTAALAERHPELGAVQDADRLDAIGAVGIGRVFAYGAARTTRPLSSSVDHFDEKLLRLEPMMKTAEGRRLARERTERLRVFKRWWTEEAAVSSGTSWGSGREPALNGNSVPNGEGRG